MKRLLALMVSLICQGIGLILSAVLAGRLTRTFVEKFNWKGILAAAVSIFTGSALGGMLAVAAVFISPFIAGRLR